MSLLFCALLLSLQELPHPMTSCLWEATLQGDNQAAAGWLDQGVYIDEADQRGRTAFMMACETPNLAMASYLLLAHAQINHTDNQSNSALHLAIQRDDLQTAVFLVERGALPTLSNHNGQTALSLAEARGHGALLHYLKDKISGAKGIAPSSQLSTYPLPSPDALLAMVLAGTRLNLPLTDSADYPLILAARLGQHQLVTALLSLGASPQIRLNFEDQIHEYNPARRAQYQGPLDVAADMPTQQRLRAFGALTLAEFHREQLNGAIYLNDLQWTETMVHSLDYLGEDPFANGLDGKNGLHHAAWFGRQDIITLLFVMGAPLNLPDRSGWAPIMWATAANQTACVQQLLSLGAFADITGPRGQSPLHLAAAQGHEAILVSLLAHEATLNRRDRNNATPLILAVEGTHESSVKHLLAAGANPNLSMPNGQWPLQRAISKDRPQLVSMLLEHGADPNLSASAGYSPLITAVENNQVAIARLLLDAGASFSLKSAAARQQLRKIGGLGFSKMTQLLLTRCTDPDALDVAAANSREKTERAAFLLKLLGPPGALDPAITAPQTRLAMSMLENNRSKLLTVIKSGFPLDTPFSNGWTPSMLATVLGRIDLLNLMLINGASPNISCAATENTAMHLAAIAGRRQAMQLLIEKGGQINSISAAGHTPLSLAVVQGQTKLVKWLLANKARRTAHRLSESLPSLAAEAGHLHMLKTLERLGMELTEGNGKGWTPLMHAAAQNQYKMLKWLLRKGAPPNQRTSNGTTPLMLAARGGCTACVRFLLSCGAYPETVGENNTTALSLAEAQGHWEVVKLLKAK